MYILKTEKGKNKPQLEWSIAGHIVSGLDLQAAWNA